MFQSSSCPVHKLFLVFSTMRSTSWSHMHRRTSGAKRYEEREREREREAAPVGTGAATLPRLIPRSEDIASWTRRVRVLSPYATIGANWTRFRVHGVAWNGRKKRGGGTEERLQGEVEEGDGRCSTCVQVASFRLAVKVLSFVPRFESCRRSRRQELAVQASPISHLPSTCIPRIVSTWNSVEIND